jgi:glycerol uptake facilitator-like aquaporin
LTAPLLRRLSAEAIGTAFLLTAVVGSGIAAENLSGGNVALALLCNAIATGAALAVLILIFGPVSGAHLNPAVSAAFGIRGELAWNIVVLFVAAQVVGAVVGVIVAHAMFDLALIQVSPRVRTGPGQWLAEAVAAFGLLLTILGTLRHRAEATAWAVGLYITAAYWFTSSTAFANPAVTIGRMLTDTFSGIRPTDAPAFIVAQFAGMALAVAAARVLWPATDEPAHRA